ncbi:hypothetical protein HS088_TW18G00458 [Tripterygium wilfordii]|uniref:Uncharacterized protein n=1 Tax=Tripterygium wilfordii TaxID=458696 RepID=A0A7J7CCB4_TRIWF|nr:uncharacterized protein LOC119983393 [Tripterygium wilfordii]KAF5731773.1 hypothetical protein HS088_TW18G00458 [Tripterygium wilfordii]
MESNRDWLVIYLIVPFMFSSIINGTTGYYDPESLDALIHSHANGALRKQRIGTLHNISLPSNFSGMEASVVRLRSSSLWSRGANFSTFYIPSRVIPLPYVKRLAIVYENLGNWSSYYHQVPNHTLIAPVIGFMAYDSSESGGLGREKLNFSFMGDPVLIHFPGIVPEDENVTLKCVRFGTGGFVEFSNLTSDNTCTTQNQGHFSIVAPSLPLPKKEEKLRKWRAILFVAGFIGLILLGLVGLCICKLVRRKRITEMENESDKGVAFDTVWIGRSRMPSASMIRTQPELEHEYAP